MPQVTTESWVMAQQAVLGSCLLEGELSAKIVYNLQPTDFTAAYRTLYAAIRELYTTGKPVDAVSVIAAAGAEYKDLVLQLIEIVPTAKNIDYYIRLVAAQAKIVQMREIGEQMALVDDTETGRQLAERAMSLEIVREETLWSMNDSLRVFWRNYAEPPDFLDWFIPQFRNILRVKKGNIVYVGARPSVGKSAFAFQAALFWAAVCGFRVGLFSHESSREEVTERMVACAAGVDYEDIQEHRLSDSDMVKAMNVSSILANCPLYIDASAGKTVQQMFDLSLKKRFDVVIIDYLQIIASPGKTEYEQVSNASKAIQRMAKKLGVTCVALVQLDRLRGAEPTMEDLRSSGQLEQDADLILLLHRVSDDRRKLIVAKNRNGICKPTLLEFAGNVQQFRYLGNGETSQKAYDYARLTAANVGAASKYNAPSFEQLPMDTKIPF